MGFYKQYYYAWSNMLGRKTDIFASFEIKFLVRLQVCNNDKLNKYDLYLLHSSTIWKIPFSSKYLITIS